MLNNYFKVAKRNLIKNKTFTLINVFGLSIGIVCALLTAAFIYKEVNVNNEIRNNHRIFLLQSKWKNADMGYDFTTLAPLCVALKENFPNLIDNYYHHDGITSIVSNGKDKFSEGLQVGDSSFLTMFGFPLVEGNAATALNEPNALVLTENKALKYFGTSHVVGKTLTLQSFSGSKQDFKITAVMKDPPYNTVSFWGNGINNGSNEFFLPASSLAFFGRDGGFRAWQNAFIISYVELKPGVDPQELQKPIAQLLKLNTTADVQKNLQVNLVPLNSYYLQSNNGIAKRKIWTLAGIAIFILLMAAINFINISIGGSTTRLREIGVRKVMGGSKKQLIVQFLCESVLLTLLSVIFALAIYSIASPSFEGMIGKQIPSLTSFPVYFIIIPFVLVLIIGIFAGIYPAFVLSKQNSISSLKGKLSSVKENIIFRRSLISIQFITGIVVFVSAIVIKNQIAYFFNADLGYSKNQVVTARVPRNWTPEGVSHMETLRNEFSKIPQVKSASFSFEITDGASAANNVIIYKASSDSSHGIISTSLFTDEKFISTYSIPKSAGNFFNENGGTPSQDGVVLNDHLAKSLGWENSHDAIGQKVKFQGSQQLFTVEGVVKDFHFSSFHEYIRPMYFVHVRNAQLYRYLSFKLNGGNTSVALAAIQKKWSELIPDAPFDYHFIDETLGKLYQTEVQMKHSAEAATTISLIIVLLGVLGIVTQSLARRTKEVGIRKVLGATPVQVIQLFTKEFIGLLVIANIIAWPLAYMVCKQWLNNYAYRVPLSALPFLLVTSIVLVAVFTTIAIKAWTTSVRNPINNLRTE